MLENENKQEELNVEQTNETQVEVDTTDYKDLYVRLLADFQNYQKRNSENLLATETRMKFKANRTLIDIYNDTYLSLQNTQLSTETLDGIKIFLNKIESALNKEDIFKMETTTYDIDNHEVVTCLVPSSKNIISVMKEGWISNGVILVHPQVILG